MLALGILLFSFDCYAFCFSWSTCHLFRVDFGARRYVPVVGTLSEESLTFTLRSRIASNILGAGSFGVQSIISLKLIAVG